MTVHFSKKSVVIGMFGALGALGLATPALAQNLVTNGGFETGDLTGWSGTVLSSPYSGVYCAGAGNVPEGSCEAFLGTDGSSDTLSQVLATEAGQLYTISFTFQSDGSTPSSLLVSFGNGSVYSSISTTSTDLQTVSFSAVATGTSTALVFNYRNDPGYFQLDGVSVTAVPEPASLAMTVAGLMALAAKRKWRLRKT